MEIKYQIDNNWSIEKDTFNWINNNVTSDSIILEFGSGLATEYLNKICKVYSVEEDIKWVNKYHDNYIHAPLENNWYNREIIKNQIPEKCDLILVDGPAYGDRMGFFTYRDLVDIKKINCRKFVFDDLERQNDLNCYNNYLEYIKSEFPESEIVSEIIKNDSKTFGYIIIK